MKNIKSPIVDGLKKYTEEKIYRFHMPGHYGRDSFPELKQLSHNLYNFDVTEVEGTDNLNCPEDIILESLDMIRDTYGAKKSYILVNGSTSGIYIAIDTLVEDNAHVIAARNCHKSVHNIIAKKKLSVDYIYPEIDKEFGVDSHIDEAKLFELIQSNISNDKKPAAVILTCPNYYGRSFSLKNIATYLKSLDIFLIIDEAHGAHFEFDNLFPKSSIRQGAHICIQSAHKTLPALTQVSMMHLGENFPESFISKLEKNINFYQTSSPSYIFMASCEIAVNLMKKHGKQSFRDIFNWVNHISEVLSTCPYIKIYGKDTDTSYTNNDFCKFFVKTPISGNRLSEILRKDYHIQSEMSIGNNILFMIGITHNQADINYLAKSILAAVSQNLDEFADWDMYNSKFDMFPKTINVNDNNLFKINIPTFDTVTLKPLALINNDICAETIIPYPPGIPLIMPFELITDEVKESLHYHKYSEIWCFASE